MKPILTGLFVILLATGVGYFSLAADKPDAKTASKDTRFDKIKSMSGEWEVTKGPADHGHLGATVSYKVTAGGSAVLETMFGGTDHEMVTLYYMDGKDLTLTHYCMLQNRPKMRADSGTSTSKIVFKCDENDKDNAKLEGEDHMRQVTITFVDADHMKADWVLYKGGKSDSTHSFELARKKK